MSTGDPRKLNSEGVRRGREEGVGWSELVSELVDAEKRRMATKARTAT